MPRGKKIVRAPLPNLSDWWGNPFCRDEVQAILREGRAWRFEQPFLASYLHCAYDTARAFTERPQKRAQAAAFFLSESSWSANGWFFRLCAAICEAYARPNLAEKIIDASRRGCVSGVRPLDPDNAFVTPGWYRGIGDAPYWQPGPDTIDEIAAALGEEGIKTTRDYVAKTLHKERKRRAGIYEEWSTWHPRFWRPVEWAELTDYLYGPGTAALFRAGR